MRLADLVDLEWLLRAGADAPAAEPDRERAVAERVCDARGLELAAARARLDSDRSLRAALCAQWLQSIRSGRSDLPGERLTHALEIAGWILVVLGVLVGAGSAKAFLAYDGTVPVNVLHFAAFFFGLQILLLALMIVFAIRARKPKSGGGPGVLHRPVAFLASLIMGNRGRETVAALRTLRARRTLYWDLERWTLFALAQRFGVAFNIAALIVALATIVFSDLVFSWSTTVDLDAGSVHALVLWLALPWRWLADAVPSLEVVQASQWERMPGTFVGGEKTVADAVQLAAQWWRFLIVGLVVWGLLPRLLALILGTLRSRRARAAANLDHAGFQALYARLLPPAVGWEGPSPDGVRGQAPVPGKGPATDHPPAPAGAPTWIVVWGSLSDHQQAVARHVTARFGADVRNTMAAGGAELAADVAAVEALRRESATRVAVLFAAGQQPTLEVVEFLRSIRNAIGADRPVVAGLVEASADAKFTDPDADELEAWRRSIAALDDPYLWVETMEIGT